MNQKKSFFTVGTVIGETINFYTDNFMKLWIPYIIIQVPFSFLTSYLTLNMYGSPFIFIISLLSSFATTVIGLYVTLAAIRLYRKNEASSGYILSDMKKVIISYILLQILIILGIIGGCILLIVPGIIFSLRWSVSGISLIDESPGIRGSMKRSKILTKGFKGQIFVVYLLLVLIGFVLLSAFSLMSSGVAGGFSGFLMNLSYQGTNPFKISSIIYTVISSLIYPLYPALTVVMYYNLKREKEGYETEELVDSFLEEETGQES